MTDILTTAAMFWGSGAAVYFLAWGVTAAATFFEDIMTGDDDKKG